MEETKIRSRRSLTKKKQLETDLATISHEMYRRNAELAETNQILSLLRAIDNLALESHTELNVLCQNIAKAIVGHSSYPFMAILVSPPHKGYLELSGWASALDKSPELPNYQIDILGLHQWLTNAQRSTHIDLRHVSDRQIAHLLHINSNEVSALRQALPLQSLVLTKLLARQRLVGLMVIGFTPTAGNLTERSQALIDRLSEAVGVALDNELLADENQRVLQQLQKTNKKLRALDETKDDFISMASHQLRTPLTSVKGYVSLVMDGDAGNITKTQRKLLSQAFGASQRMVDLVADLLNVSRLKTGKFVLELKATNLAETVSEEMGRLQEIAASRNLMLTYNKPKNFPTLTLDELKIRQVIMNFIDNAIWYTPSGGHITVNLTDKPEAIELTVVDDGIGVPEAEKPHLFTKFYRAPNAQKARPDGTGIGLYLAKEVISAQGGSLIFKSEEGKGSTFGFRFEKASLKNLPKTESLK